MSATSVIFPTIDLGEVSDEILNQKLREASERWGCYRVINHGVSLSVKSDMKKTIMDLFERPYKVKVRNTDVQQWSGYTAQSEINPYNEALGLYDTASPQAVNTFSEAVGKPSGVNLHTDWGFLTILQDDENVGGLEAIDPSSETVFPLPPLANSLAINLGDMATIWSNGRLCNVKHRVQCNEAKTRFSIASFLLGPMDTDLEAPSEFVDAEHPRLYKAISHKGYRSLRMATNLHDGEALKLISYE
ncbi:unnamed protein product [Brassica oleracea var. botrytis]